MRFQAHHQKVRKKDGQEGYFPLNGIVIWRDFSLNVKRYASQLVTPKQSRNPKEMSLENYLVYIPKPRESIYEPVKFSVYCFHLIGDSGKHDTFTAAVNIRTVLNELKERKLWKDDGSVVFLHSDGCPKEYKNANAMGLLKKLCKDFNIALQLDFYASGNGKGLVDSVGGVFRRCYASDCVKALKADARKVDKIAEWFLENAHEFKCALKDSRQKVNFVF